MNFLRQTQQRKKGELRIIGAISIDLNGISDDEVPKELDEESQNKVFQMILKEFCSNSTVHGIRYLTERKRHWIERLWWMIAFSLSVVFCMIAILSIWYKWHRRPVIVTFNDKTTSVGMIPFPAVTICSTEKYTRSKLDIDHLMELANLEINHTMFSSLSSQDINQIDAIMHICFKEFQNMEENMMVPRTESIYETITKIAPDQGLVVVFATWLDQLTHFRRIFTGEGACYTFNAMNSREIYSEDIAPELITVIENPSATHWNMERGYESNINESKIYPYRVFGCGLRDSLTVVLNILLDDSLQFCMQLAEGFRISLHAPDELPRLPDEFIHIPAEQDIYISVKPRMITTSRGLRRYTPNLRGCYFKTGRGLRFFRAYSQQHCEMECLSNFTKEMCGCVKFAMARDNKTKVCTMADINCYINAEYVFKRNQNVSSCRCLPDCTAITYDVEISQAQTRYSANDLALKNQLSDSNSSFEATSKLFMSFKENHFIALNRTESYTLSDFIASCGGLLGLFMGISMLSVVELIYFFTLRLCCKLRNRKSSKVETMTWAKRKNVAVARNKRIKLLY